MNRISKILGPDGSPLVMNTNGKGPSLKMLNSFLSGGSVDSYIQGLTNLRLPVDARLLDPFGNHIWVFAAAIAIATVASQAPYRVYQETGDEILLRQKAAEAIGRQFVARRGKSRRALLRHLSVPVSKRLRRKGLTLSYEHPIQDVLLNPNPYQQGNQLFQTTILWMSIRGEFFWVLDGADGGSMVPGELPSAIWGFSPDLFQPVFEKGTMGELTGWRFRVPDYAPQRLNGAEIILPVSDVIQFKFPNPAIPYRGLSRIAAAAGTIDMDLRAKEYNKSILENNGDPGGVLSYDTTMSSGEEADFLARWEQRHRGGRNARRTALLSGGMKYTPVALGPQDLQYLEELKWGREEILAAMGVPQSVLGVTEYINFATQLGQDKNFWDKNLIPLLELIETTLDGTLFFNEPDTICGAFDFKGVEALRAGVAEKIDTAIKLCGQELHMPPADAFELLGLEVPDYEGNDKALIPPMVSTVEDIIASSMLTTTTDPFSPPGTTGTPGSDGLSVPTDVPPAPTDKTPNPDNPNPPADPTQQYELAARKVLQLKGKHWDAFIKVQESLENPMKVKYRGWVYEERRLVLAELEKVGSKALKGVIASLLTAILPPLKGMQDRLKAKVRPIYTSALNETWKFTVNELGGIPVFEMDDPRIMDYFDRREKKFLATTPNTVRNNLAKALSESIRTGEDMNQVRVRVSQVYDVAASPAKVLSVARTETASFMNGVRDVMFEAQGFEEFEWTTAGDEHVRGTHVKYGESGPHPKGFDYLTITNKKGGGKLKFPGDDECTLASEVVNCRCVLVPIK